MDTPDHNSDNGLGAAEADHTGTSAGQILRNARLSRGLSIQDVARQLRLSVRQVTALEEDDYSKLSAGTFLRGFVRNYAKLLQVDPQPLLSLIEESVPPPQPQTISYQIEGIPFPSQRNQGRRMVIMGAAVAVALSLLIYEIYRGNETNAEKRQAEVKTEIKDLANTPGATQPSQPAPSAMNEIGEASTPQAEKAGKPPGTTEMAVVEQKPPTPAPAVQPPAIAFPSKPMPKPADAVPPKVATREVPSAASASAPPESADTAGEVVRLSFEGESWVEVKDGRGKLLLSRVNPPGTQQVLRGNPPFSLTIGNAAQVKLIYNNKPVDLARYTNIYGGTARLSLE